MQNSIPIIGLTLDHEPPGGYSKYPWYAIRENYFRAVISAGGLPIALPHEPDMAVEYVKLIDGLIVTGGNFDICPHIFGALSKHSTVKNMSLISPGTKNHRPSKKKICDESFTPKDQNI